MWGQNDKNNIPDGFKLQIKNRFTLLNSIDPEPEELWTESGNIIRQECKKTMPEVIRREKLRWMTEETLKIIKGIKRQSER